MRPWPQAAPRFAGPAWGSGMGSSSAIMIQVEMLGLHIIYILYTYYIHIRYILYTYYIHSIFILYTYYIDIYICIYIYYISHGGGLNQERKR